MKPRRLITLLLAGLLLATAGCGGGGDEGGEGGDNAITFWLNEDVAQRVAAIETIVKGFQEKSGVSVKVVAIAEDQLATQIQSASAAGTLPDVMGPMSLGLVQNLATDDLADPDAANEVIESLGRDTFSERALSLVQADGKPMGVPSDTWTQLLVYRKDLFEKAGLETPDTFDKILAAATKLKQPGQNGIVAATKAGEAFTEQTFEYFALANGCQLDRRPGRDPAHLAPVRGHLRVLRRPDQGRLGQGRPGRRHHPRRLPRRQGGDDRVVDVPARRAGRAAQRRAADLRAVPQGQALPVREQRRGHRHPGAPTASRPSSGRSPTTSSSRTATSTRPSSSSST